MREDGRQESDQAVAHLKSSDFVVQEFFRYLDKARHLRLEEEVKACEWIRETDPQVARWWSELIRQAREGIRH